MNRLVRERRMLNIWILRASIGLCLSLIIIGLLLFFFHGSTKLPVAPAGSLFKIIHHAMVRGAKLHADAFLDTGIVLLLLTPMLRLLAGVYVSMRARDWLYTCIGLLVLVLVITGIIFGQISDS